MTTRAYEKPAELSQRGPSWLDTLDLWQEIEKAVGLRIEYRVRMVVSVGGKRGQYLTLWVEDVDVQGIGSGYGPSHPGGATTFPAALYDLLSKFYNLRAGLTPLERTARWGEPGTADSEA